MGWAATRLATATGTTRAPGNARRATAAAAPTLAGLVEPTAMTVSATLSTLSPVLIPFVGFLPLGASGCVSIGAPSYFPRPAVRLLLGPW